MRLILVRHGQTDSNVIHALDTEAPGADLTELGRRQAEALVAELGEEDIESMWVSNLVRTHQTAAPLAGALGLTPIEREGLREIRAGDLEMANGDAEVRTYLEGIMAWTVDPDSRMPGAETGREVKERYDAVVAEIVATGQETAMIVSHGAVIVSWAASTVEVPREFLGRSISNTGVVIIEGDPTDGWQLVRWESRALGGPSVSDVEHDGPAGYPDERHPDSLGVAGRAAED
ncbi:histidine phosphatase family protein [Georgenia sp. Z1344]|uniref:histidine phosphatase family protein n=1 Tax=Georgenia sp. Z1344 TaxID=3416706 RepID=UPI003CEB1976